jgi:predicted AlkP superfamily pyrophosphatase or phosphodiesterase
MTDPRPFLPDYGSKTLSELLPSVGAHLGVPGAEDHFGLPQADHYVLLLIDGLGWNQLQEYPIAPTLGRAQVIHCGIPSTTATSLTSLGTGLAPGRHGIAGYTFRYRGQELAVLHWPKELHGLDVQPQLTYLERMKSAGVSVHEAMPAKFEGSGLTTAALRGPVFWGLPDEAAIPVMVETVARSAQAGERTFSYLYERVLDHQGHEHGVGSAQWLAALQRAEDLVRKLRSELPDDTVVLAAADHGMVNVPQSGQVIYEDYPELSRGVELLAGEGRLRQVYTRAPEAVAARWQEILGERAWVVTRQEAVAANWFGPADPRLADRFGDVLVALRGGWAVMTRRHPNELALVGMHGSLTAAEVEVPLLVLPGRG